MARKKNTETPVTEDIQAQDPTVTLETPVVSNTESETQEKDTVESPDETTLKEPSPKKDKAEKFGNQQNQKLIPSLAVDGVDAAAKDIQHQRRDNIAGQSKQPLCHQSQKSYKQRDRGKHHLEQNPHIKHQPFLSPLL